MVRAPGRVNLIGEHIDYAGFPVFPMAVQRQIALAFRAIDEPVCRAVSTAPDLSACAFRLDGAFAPGPAGFWENYFKAAAVGLSERGVRLCGIEAAVASNLPIAAGLGSSSALVVAAALALLTAADEEIPPLELATCLADAEQFTGTRGGGMDQAICLCGREGEASRIEFNPLRLEHIPVPLGWRFVVAFSLVEARKSGAAQRTYNARRAEVEEALARVRAGAPPIDRRLSRRYRHVAGEAERVTRAIDAMRGADLEGFGTLMTESHVSLRDDFEVSVPELDELVELALEAGAAGARLTGAGLGGSVVALCEAAGVARVLEAWAERFYGPRGVTTDWGMDRRGPATDISPRGPLFAAVPSPGASIHRV